MSRDNVTMPLPAGGVLLARLRTVSEKITQLRRRTALLTMERDVLILQATREGATQAAVAEAAGTTQARVSQIVLRGASS